MQALKIIGRGAGLEGAAAQKTCTAGFYRGGNRFHLLFGFHRAGPGDKLKMAAADLDTVDDPDYRVFGMKLPVRFFEGLGNPGHILHDVKPADQVGVDAGGITDQADNRLVLTYGHMCADIVGFQPADQMIHFFLADVLLQ